MSEQGNTIHKSNRKVSEEFTKTLITGLCQGACEAVVDFVPSLCSTTYGLGKTLWATTQHPIESIKIFASACYEMGERVVDYCKTVSRDAIEGYWTD